VTEAGIAFNTGDLAASYGNPGDLELVDQVGFAFHVIGLTGVSTSGGHRIASLQQPIARSPYPSRRAGGWRSTSATTARQPVLPTERLRTAGFSR